jgi:4-hydroxy-4-methyl-2-oxoglutarate aldolase
MRPRVVSEQILCEASAHFAVAWPNQSVEENSMSNPPAEITLEMMRQSLYSAVVCDVLDSLGHPRQSPRIPLKPFTIETVLVGRAKTTLWTELEEVDPSPYEKELAAVDECRPDDVLIAARNRGCVGAIVDGAVRDVAKMREMQFPVFARATSPYDSKDRQCVTHIDVPVTIDGVDFHPGELVFADLDGVVVVPRSVEAETIRLAWQKVHAENEVRQAIQNGMEATEAYRRFGAL